MSDDTAEWLRKEAQRHSQSAGDKAFTSRRRATFKHRAKKLRQAAAALVQKQAVIDDLLESLDEAKFTEPELRAKLDKQRQRIEQLEKQVYLAGHWSCPKCKFYLVSTNLHVSSGGFSANNEPQQCANGCGPMWKVTHEQSADTMVDRCEKQTDRIEQLEVALREASTDPAGEYYFGLHCGIEDNELMDRYEAADYGWKSAFEYAQSIADPLFAGGSNQEFNTAKRRPDAGLSETESPEGDATARTSGRGSDGDKSG